MMNLKTLSVATMLSFCAMAASATTVTYTFDLEPVSIQLGSVLIDTNPTGTGSIDVPLGIDPAGGCGAELCDYNGVEIWDVGASVVTLNGRSINPTDAPSFFRRSFTVECDDDFTNCGVGADEAFFNPDDLSDFRYRPFSSSVFELYTPTEFTYEDDSSFTATYDGIPLIDGGGSGIRFTASVSNLTIAVSPPAVVPLPASISLLGLGILGFGLLKRRRS